MEQKTPKSLNLMAATTLNPERGTLNRLNP
jgi:hypothetical protein